MLWTGVKLGADVIRGLLGLVYTQIPIGNFFCHEAFTSELSVTRGKSLPCVSGSKQNKIK